MDSSTKGKTNKHQFQGPGNTTHSKESWEKFCGAQRYTKAKAKQQKHTQAIEAKTN